MGLGGTTRRGFLRGMAATAVAAPLTGVLSGCESPARQIAGRWAAAGPVDLGAGSWCWFSSPRSVVNGSAMLFTGGVVTGTGTHADGDVFVSKVDLASRHVSKRWVVGRTTQPDDHAHPSLSLPNGPDGAVEVAWAPHSLHGIDRWLWAGQLGAPLKKVHEAGGIAYAARAVVGGERWMLSRFIDRTKGRSSAYSWCLMRDRGTGKGWVVEGTTVLAIPGTSGRPYHMVCSDGKRLHVFASDGNPSDVPAFGSSVHHFCIEQDLTITDGRGRAFGRVGTRPPRIDSLPVVWRGGGDASGVTPTGWPVSVEWIDGRPNALISYRGQSTWTGRMPRWGLTGENAYVWARRRLDGSWQTRRIAHAGSNLYPAQPNYTGLAALNPLDWRSVVISTNTHPVTSTPLRSSADGIAHWELWAGLRSDSGAWSWAPITANSRVDNLRPHLAAGGGRLALTYMAGSYPDYYTPRTRLLARSIRT
ncbi:MAG: hypothetical protein JWM47_3591 [Acidimicrobiales bacterium]|nr:hypothetical protein [Acidimicrobiales bacterium]